MRYRYHIPEEVMRSADPLEEFAKDAAIASIRTRDGRTFSPCVIVSPNYIGALEGFDHLPFSEEEIEEVFQTEDDLKKRSSSTWTWFTADE